MTPDHAYLVAQMKPVIAIARQMDDRLPSYFLSMLLKHCREKIKDQNISVRKTKLQRKAETLHEQPRLENQSQAGL